MPKYIIAYRGGKKPSTKEEGKIHIAKWQKWFANIGKNIVSPPAPLGKSKIVNSSGVFDADKNAMNGYLIVKADDMDAALEIAKSDPFLEMEGAIIEVAQVMEMGK